ncbi:FBD, F-box/LRR protein [Arabidopsis thaliana]|uniref:FBD, F-box/LRR protein n=1 Tax=Arabidopsis thaliana TaxID=3702 RepID=UPI0001E92EE2|nr:FBD, F-box/LRR protein [Arabidopsis thaliana]AEE83548.1 FBD, F-box/LRR protein [Arabidopsis thaliana]|eukprot:NP_193242.3 FBD, F-box/LRR protein [Arabidopsis thaliana]
MPNLEEADISSTYPDIYKFVRSVTSVKRLSLCIRVNAEEALYPDGIVFNQLENLKLCPCDSNWSKLFVRLLKYSPNLRELEVSLNEGHTKCCVDPQVSLENQLNFVPECLLSSLQTFKWTGIHGSLKVMDLAKYILRNARCLKTATILFQPALETERETMIQELLLSFRDMDKISRLPDDLLVKVLLFLPTKIAVSTSILSKRWEFLWMWLPKLEYHNTNYSASEEQRLRSFINLNLQLHRAPIIESLRLKFSLGRSIKPQNIKQWIIIAVFRCVRELSINLFPLYCIENPAKLPSSLYISKSLVILKLKDQILVDVPRMAYLPSLKYLLLKRVTYKDSNSLHQLLSSCPVLKNLVVERDEYNHDETLSITVSSLQRLTLKISRGGSFDELVINTPSLKYFKLTDYLGECETELDDDSYSYVFKDMPKLEEAHIDSTYPDIGKFVRSITSVKRLSLCVKVNAEEDSPNLRELEIKLNKDHKASFDDPACLENQLNYVVQSSIPSLERFTWTWIYGSQNEIDYLEKLKKRLLLTNWQNLV